MALRQQSAAGNGGALVKVAAQVTEQHMEAAHSGYSGYSITGLLQQQGGRCKACRRKLSAFTGYVSCSLPGFSAVQAPSPNILQVLCKLHHAQHRLHCE